MKMRKRGAPSFSRSFGVSEAWNQQRHAENFRCWSSRSLIQCVGIMAVVCLFLTGLALFVKLDRDNDAESSNSGAFHMRLSNFRSSSSSRQRDDEMMHRDVTHNEGVTAVNSRDSSAVAGISDEKSGPLQRQEAKLSLQRPPRFVTVVMPSVVNEKGRLKRLSAIADTWGPTSRAVYVVHDTSEFPHASQNVVQQDGSTLSNQQTSALYPKLLVLPSSITPDKGVLRLQHVITTTSHVIDPDFAFFVNDHTFVIPQHLCEFLSNYDPMNDLYAGHALKNQHEAYAFNSGAAGYVLSRKTMERLVQKWDSHDPKCVADNAPKWLQGNPGLVTARCLKDSLHVPLVDTRDTNRLHRFHAFGLVRTLSGKVDDWYIKKHEGLDQVLGVDNHVHHQLGKGLECCSPSTVSFHYVEHFETRALYETMQHLASNPTMGDDELMSLVRNVSPKDPHELGFYAHSLPNDTNKAAWNDLLAVLRKISLKDPSDIQNRSGAPC